MLAYGIGVKTGEVDINTAGIIVTILKTSIVSNTLTTTGISMSVLVF